jgi:mannose-6-phosphate isomerase-like protein (cupin superfamily)
VKRAQSSGTTPRPIALPHPSVIEAWVHSRREGVCWKAESADLNLNLIAWSSRHGIRQHINQGCDVLLVGLAGRGRVSVGRSTYVLAPGRCVVLPRGTSRSLRATTRLVYLSCHKRQPGTFAAEDLFPGLDGAGARSVVSGGLVPPKPDAEARVGTRVRSTRRASRPRTFG